MVGGAPEALLAKPGKPEIILNARKGFIKLAIQLGTDLVPVFGFGENDMVGVIKVESDKTLKYVVLAKYCEKI